MKQAIYTGLLFIFSLTQVTMSLAQSDQFLYDQNQTPELISAAAISAIAKDSIVQETTYLNTLLLDPQNASSPYKRRLLESFFQQSFKNQIDPEELYNKCVYSKTDLINLNNPVLRPEDDATAAKMRALETVGALYGREVWRLFSQACGFARTRFESRLSQLTSQGQPINLNSDQIANLSSILFFPTVVGTAPSRTMEFVSSLFKTAILGSFIFGPVTALSGMAVGGSVILVASATNSSHGLLGEIMSAFQKTPNEKLAALLSKSPVEMSLDLTPNEETWKNGMI